MNILKKTLLTLCTLSSNVLFINSVHANIFDLALSNKTALLTLSNSDTSQANRVLKASYFHHEDDADMLDVSFLVGDTSKEDTFLLGGKIYYINLNNTHGYGLALGAEAEFNLAPQLYLQGQAYYAPQVTSFTDVENYREVELRIAYDIIPQASISLGYRNAKVNLENGASDKFQDSAFVAISLKF
jgi:hypothetical protein